jgi:hypothetical protein
MASFKSDRVHFHWNIRLLPATQADSHAGSKVYIWNVFGLLHLPPWYRVIGGEGPQTDKTPAVKYLYRSIFLDKDLWHCFLSVKIL